MAACAALTDRNKKNDKTYINIFFIISNSFPIELKNKIQNPLTYLLKSIYSRNAPSPRFVSKRYATISSLPRNKIIVTASHSSSARGPSGTEGIHPERQHSGLECLLLFYFNSNRTEQKVTKKTKRIILYYFLLQDSHLGITK